MCGHCGLSIWAGTTYVSLEVHIEDSNTGQPIQVWLSLHDACVQPFIRKLRVSTVNDLDYLYV